MLILFGRAEPKQAIYRRRAALWLAEVPTLAVQAVQNCTSNSVAE
jgi:hypothetical protein